MLVWKVMFVNKFEETKDGIDFQCDASRHRRCKLTCHVNCYEQRWGESSGDKCACTQCAICGEKTKAGEYTIKSDCRAEFHVECARQHDFYCVICYLPLWDKAEYP